jgi:hypothetical protein
MVDSRHLFVGQVLPRFVCASIPVPVYRSITTCSGHTETAGSRYITRLPGGHFLTAGTALLLVLHGFGWKNLRRLSSDEVSALYATGQFNRDVPIPLGLHFESRWERRSHDMKYIRQFHGWKVSKRKKELFARIFRCINEDDEGCRDGECRFIESMTDD